MDFEPTVIDQAQRNFYDGLRAANDTYMRTMNQLMLEHAEAMHAAEISLDPRDHIEFEG